MLPHSRSIPRPLPHRAPHSRLTLEAGIHLSQSCCHLRSVRNSESGAETWYCSVQPLYLPRMNDLECLHCPERTFRVRRVLTLSVPSSPKLLLGNHLCSHPEPSKFLLLVAIGRAPGQRVRGKIECAPALLSCNVTSDTNVSDVEGVWEHLGQGPPCKATKGFQGERKAGHTWCPKPTSNLFCVPDRGPV